MKYVVYFCVVMTLVNLSLHAWEYRADAWDMIEKMRCANCVAETEV